MKVLLVKMSSLGDIVHTLPALTDAAAALPGLQLDWLVEENFLEVPRWHRAVQRVQGVAQRRWRSRPWSRQYRKEWHHCRALLRQSGYQQVVDAQGLLKSAWLCSQVGAYTTGYDSRSARESLACLAYDRKIPVERKLHAIERSRQLLAAALDYAHPGTEADYGLADSGLVYQGATSSAVMFLHGSARSDKLWPEANWVQLAQILHAEGLQVLLPWGNEAERQRAGRIAESAQGVRVLDNQGLTDMARGMCQVRAAVAVDTGLGHIAAALGVPAVSLYGRSCPQRVGTRGRWQRQVQAQGTLRSAGQTQMASIEVARVWLQLQELLLETERSGS